MIKKSKNILINATASFSGGALTILKQFLDNVKHDDGNHYTVFGMSGLVEKENVTFIEKNTQQKIWERIKWEFFGIRKWLRNNDYDLIITFQNTGVIGARKTPQLIYYHQPVALFDFKWNFLKKRERGIFFYKRIYPLIVSALFTKNTFIVVQLQAIKNAFIKKFSFNPEKVFVCRPSLNLPDSSCVGKIDFKDAKKTQFLYPFVQVVPYKNYEILLKAIEQMSNEEKKSIVLHFTCNKEDLMYLKGYDDVWENITFHNKPSYEALLTLFNSVDVVLFPSFIETFGLPLLEAASFGVPVYAADVDYAHEVLEGYKNASFVDYNNVTAWKEVMINASKLQERTPFKGNKYTNEWSSFFELINRL